MLRRFSFGEMAVAALWTIHCVGHTASTHMEKNERILVPIGRGGTIVQRVSNYVMGCVLAATTGG